MLATMPIPTFARWLITQNRESIKETHGVSLYFPRNGILPNNHQEMKMEGSNNSITMVKRIIDGLMDEARKSYQEYRVRKQTRDEKTRRYNAYLNKKPDERVTKPTTGKAPMNTFAVLEEMDEDGFQPVKSTKKNKNPVVETKEEFPQLGNNQTEKNTTPITWGPGMNNQKEDLSCVGFPTISGAWGDIDSDEE
jgi:hypothetical protein